jgi:enoyl-CoA hydratase
MVPFYYSTPRLTIVAMPVTFERRDGVAVITLDDGKANAIGTETLSELAGALDRLDEEPQAHAVLLVGRPGRFSAGFDLKAMTASTETMRSLVKGGAELTARLLLEPRPVVAACTGHALAAGALLLLAADHRIGADGDWRIGLNEVAIGMPMPRWGVELARYRLRPSDLDWRLVLGQTATPQEAVAAGFLDRVVPAEDVVDEAFEAAAELAGLKTGAVSGTKRRLREEVVSRMLWGIDEDLASVSGPAD